MDWLKGMNDVIKHIEGNLTQPIQHETLARMVGCSIYEFSRIFSFMAGMSVSEYIRRRRLSQAVFDIQKGSEKIIDIALKYGYESPAAFTRAFKELHNTTPLSARKMNVPLKTYPAISFVLTIKGVDEMNFRIEKMEQFQVMGLSGYIDGELVEGMPAVWHEFYAHVDPKISQYYAAPFWQAGVYDFEPVGGKSKVLIGAEYKGERPEGAVLDVVDVPAATWVVFSIKGCIGETYDAAYARILAEWFPGSGYKRDERVPHLEVMLGGGEDGIFDWEVWMPVQAGLIEG
ncbi:MAG: AraC family transcriptional regulator [Defluviitaleaceae bacterium]|nr:AraC family transcriptional regulator [Defluviitaleaceae bacterium]